MANPDLIHIPVMLTEVLTYLTPEAGKVYMDGTFGRGGYTKALLERGAQVIAVDRDPEAIAQAEALKHHYPQALRVIHGSFAHILKTLTTPLDGLVLDLGVSSPQIEDPTRGFSFRFNGPLDMRMDPRVGLSAADVVNTYAEKELADIIYTLGEERASRAIAKAICLKRVLEPFATTQDLARLIRTIVRASKDGLDPATRTFQAFRIFVNQELDELSQALECSLTHLKINGRLVIVSFHSLEDRLAKHFLRTHSAHAPNPSRHSFFDINTHKHIPLKLLTSKALKPTSEECRMNPRASSARLRAAEIIEKTGESSCHA